MYWVPTQQLHLRCISTMPRENHGRRNPLPRTALILPQPPLFLIMIRTSFVCLLSFLNIVWAFSSYSLDALSTGEMYSLDMGSLKSANSTALSWTDVQKPDLGDGYKPVMALAQNHIHFLNVPGIPAGSAKIFVIHCEVFPLLHPLRPADDVIKFPSCSQNLSPLGNSPQRMVRRRRFLKTPGCVLFPSRVIGAFG